MDKNVKDKLHFFHKSRHFFTSASTFVNFSLQNFTNCLASFRLAANESMSISPFSILTTISSRRFVACSYVISFSMSR